MGNLAAFGPSQVLANQPPGAKLPLEDAGEARVPCVSQEPSAVCRALLRVDCCSPESWLASLRRSFPSGLLGNFFYVLPQISAISPSLLLLGHSEQG